MIQLCIGKVPFDEAIRAARSELRDGDCPKINAGGLGNWLMWNEDAIAFLQPDLEARGVFPGAIHSYALLMLELSATKRGDLNHASCNDVSDFLERLLNAYLSHDCALARDTSLRPLVAATAVAV